MIGIFDSGSGGLSVLSEIRKIMPETDVVYLGDIKNAPYGSKSREELGALTSAAVSRLLSEGATKIVSACNSVSASIVLPMLSILSLKPFDMVEMVGPTVKALKNENRKILLVATPATIASAIYQQGFRSVGKEIMTLAIPDLAGAIEFGSSETEMEKMIEKALGELRNSDFELLVLGCTHYPLIKNLFEKVLDKVGKKAVIYDPAVAVANEVKTIMDENGGGKTRFLITKDSVLFRERVAEMFGTNNIKVEVV